MISTFNKETGSHEWKLESWIEKALYVIGCIYTFCFVVAFVFGLASALSMR